MSKIRKMIVNMKNRKEKDPRMYWVGSNPHSKGESFSLEAKTAVFKIDLSMNRRMQTIIKVNNMILISSKDFLIGNQIYFYIKIKEGSSINKGVKEESYNIYKVSISNSRL